MNSTHPKADQLLKSGCFTNLSTFSEFEQRLRTLANTKEVGDAFEILVEAYLHTQPTMQVKNVWLVGQVPRRIRTQLNLPSDSKGIDGVFETRSDELVPYQVKYRADTDVLPYGEVSSFLGITERSCKDRLIFTNARALSKDVENRDGLRSVRASHLHALTREDFAVMEAWLSAKPVPRVRRKPRPYQQEAVEKIAASLKAQHRTTAVMACGTGKTLVALWVAEKIEPKTVLVLVPSLALLSQTLPDWCKDSKWSDSLEFLCVCSDPTVSREADAYTIRPQDADFPITTDSRVVNQFLTHPSQGVKVIFSTYQSAPVVAEGMNELDPLDFAVFDEAHKTTGPQAGLFAFALADKNLPIRKRLFVTATPRHYDIRRRDKEGDFRLVSMDDETIYGPVSYRLSFVSAVKQEIICPYEIVISVTTEAEVDNELLRRGITLVDRNPMQAKWVATQLALKRAIEETKASKIISFHSRVSLGEDFASDESRGIRHYLNDFEVLHVNGNQSTADREDLLDDFKAATKALITNARCLTEGVDVPAVDMVAFIDPRRSKVDIAQATGRAMRQSKETGKTTGYIVVPLFLEQQMGETEQEALERSGFEEVAIVIAAMQEQDEDLVDVIRQLRQEKGEGNPFRPRLLAERVQVIGPSVSLEELTKAICVKVVERLGSNWDEMYGRLVHFCDRSGHCVVPKTYTTDDGVRLGAWVSKQRARRVSLTPERRTQLESLTRWVWARQDAAWEVGFSALQRYVAEHHHANAPSEFTTADRYRVGRWVVKQRRKRYSMTSAQQERLEHLNGWVWHTDQAAWEAGFSALKEYVEKHGNAMVPFSHTTDDGVRLGAWVSKQRGKRNSLTRERRTQLESLTGWVWATQDTAWEAGYSALKRFVERHGNAMVPKTYTTDDRVRLGAWVSKQRQKRRQMPQERQKQLESLNGWAWRVRDSKNGN